MEKLKETKTARIGIYTIEGLRERMITYGEFIAGKVRAMDHVEVFYYGLVDCPEEGRRAGEYFNEHNVDLIFAHAGTYGTSASVLPVHQI